MVDPVYIDYSSHIDGLVVIESKSFYDPRGMNWEGVSNSQLYTKTGLEFNVDSFSYSVRGTIRGFHGDKINWKLIQCIYGSIFFAVIDVRPESPTFGKMKHWSRVWASENQVFLLPPGIVNAHQCLSDDCKFFYKLSKGYTSHDQQISVKWNDPKYKVPWPITDNILISDRDK